MSTSPYTYVMNNPVSYIDLLGLESYNKIIPQDYRWVLANMSNGWGHAASGGGGGNYFDNINHLDMVNVNGIWLPKSQVSGDVSTIIFNDDGTFSASNLAENFTGYYGAMDGNLTHLHLDGIGDFYANGVIKVSDIINNGNLNFGAFANLWKDNTKSITGFTFFTGATSAGLGILLDKNQRFKPFKGGVGVMKPSKVVGNLQNWDNLLLGFGGTNSLRLFKGLSHFGYAATAVGVFVTGYDVAVGNISVAKGVLDVGMAGVGLMGWQGALISTIYFGVDVFYPGGWEGLGTDAFSAILRPGAQESGGEFVREFYLNGGGY